MQVQIKIETDKYKLFQEVMEGTRGRLLEPPVITGNFIVIKFETNQAENFHRAWEFVNRDPEELHPSLWSRIGE